MIRSNREAARALAALAYGQGGYFTAKQARAAGGYNHPHLANHVAVGNFERIDRGLFRLAAIRGHEHDDLIRLSLWSRNRKDESQAVVSHDTALVLHGLSGTIPTAIHLIVPPRFRKRCPPRVVIHRRSLLSIDIEKRTGFRVTTPLRTLLDAAVSGMNDEPLGKALGFALSRDLVRPMQLAEALGPVRGAGRLRKLLVRKQRWRR